MTLTTVVPFEVFVLLFVCSDAYITFRLYQFFRHFIPGIRPFWFIIICIVIFALAVMSFIRAKLPVSPAIKHVLNVYGGYWMGAFVYLFLLYVLADLIMLVLGLTGIISFPASSYARFVSGVIVIVATAIIVTGGVIHANNFVHRTYTVESEKELGGRQWNIALISDVHLGAVNSEKRLVKLVKEINASSPDLVLISGDTFDNDFLAIQNPDRCAETLKKINAKYGVYACLGNHDTGSTINDMIDFLPKCGIKLLAEEYAVVDDSLIVAGRLDKNPIGENGSIKRGDFEAMMTGADTTLPIVVLDHNPAHIDEYPGWVDIILCGHTHKGQIFPGNLFTSVLFPVDFGEYRKDENSPKVIVSSGAGTWGMPMRVGTDDEIVAVNFSGKQ